MRIYKTKKYVLRFYQDAERFLNGLTSNDMSASSNAFLNVHGKIVATFDQIRIDDEEILILVEKPFVDAVLDHIEKFLKISPTKVEKLDDVVFFDLDNELELIDGEKKIPQSQGALVISKRHLQTTVSEVEFTIFRLENNIAVHGIDFKDEFLLNVSTSSFVSFTKGCYLGQEPVSKVHNRSKPTWKLVVKDENECSEEEKSKMTSIAQISEDGSTRGFVFTNNVTES